MQTTRIIAIRHGETAWNADTRIQGHLDIPLNPTGRWQAQQLAKSLSAETLDAIYSSDLSRAFETASAISQNHPELAGREPTQLPALRERCFGAFEGQTWSEVETQWPEQAQRWHSRDIDFSPEGGETLVELHSRIESAVDSIAQQHPGQQIALVAHGGVMDVLYRLATRLDLQAPRTWALGNTAVNRLLWSPEGLSLVGWSDTRHLDQGSLDEAAA
ncbi:MAG: histidine phosphatase family protein [Burkholderiaceae bacterium]